MSTSLASGAAAAAGTAAAANGASLLLGGPPSQRSSVGTGGEGREVWRGATSAGVESGGGSGGVSGGGDVSRRPSNRGFRQQSVEDDLWGWFGDDRPPSETALHAMPRGDGHGMEVAAATGIGTGGWRGDSTEVTVSTLALTERLAKLSAGRVLLDRVRGDTRSLAAVVSAAARSAFVGHASVATGDPGDPDTPDTIKTPAASAAVATEAVDGEEESTSGGAPQMVHFTGGSPPPSTGGEEGRSPGRRRPEGQSAAVAPDAEREEAPKDDAEAAGTEAEGHGHGEGPPPPAEENASRGATGMEVTVPASTMVAATTGVSEGPPPAALRERVVQAKGELQGLQTEIRRLVREAGVGDAGRREEARGRVGPLVARRAGLAAAARADAERMATRLQEISEAQKVRERAGGGGIGLELFFVAADAAAAAASAVGAFVAEPYVLRLLLR